MYNEDGTVVDLFLFNYLWNLTLSILCNHDQKTSALYLNISVTFSMILVYFIPYTIAIIIHYV